MPDGYQWVVCQLGAREHYVIASVVSQNRQLRALLTEVWAKPGSMWAASAKIASFSGRRALSKAITGRYRDLAAEGKAYSPGLLHWLMPGSPLRAFRQQGMARHHRIGRWFGGWAARQLSAQFQNGASPSKTIVFSYSYAALDVFREARKAGCTLVLGQIDGGPEEYNLVQAASQRNSRTAGPLEVQAEAEASARYWSDWHEECRLADAIIANSQWSARLLVLAGIEQHKIRVVPLAFEQIPHASARTYPSHFTKDRPFRVLFLGQVCTRKGVFELLEAMTSLSNEPLVLRMIGSGDASLQSKAEGLSNVEYLGAVARTEVSDHYTWADAFILPTHSDGFAITQLEAQSHGLPVFASRFCGEVVEDFVNGRLINRVTPEAIASILKWGAQHPGPLAEMSRKSLSRMGRYAPQVIFNQLTSIVDGLHAGPRPVSRSPAPAVDQNE
jgi:hypothetical protein